MSVPQPPPLIVTTSIAAISIALLTRLYINHAIKSPIPHKRTPRLTLVGAGPGDAKLLTMAAVEALGEAELIMVDVLVPDEVTKLYANPTARVVKIDKPKGKSHESQDDVMRECLAALESGVRRVVRLKGGDPFLYGRGGEEVEYFCRLKRFEVRVIPGVSSATAGPAAAGIPVTTRGFADSLLVLTAHGKKDTDPLSEARYVPTYLEKRTVVFLMSVSRAEALATRLMTVGGFPRELPCAIIERATIPTLQRVFRFRLGEMAEVVRREQVTSPALILVGGTASWGCREDDHAGRSAMRSEWCEGGVNFYPASNDVDE